LLQLSQAFVRQLVQLELEDWVVVALALQAFLDDWDNLLLLLLSEQANVVLEPILVLS